MADNVTITENANSTPPDGTIIATDEVSGVQYQAMKIALGLDGVVDTLLDSGQQTSANSVPVTLASDQSAVNVAMSTEGTTAKLLQALVEQQSRTNKYLLELLQMMSYIVDGNFEIE